MAAANVQVVDSGAATDAGTDHRTVTLAGASAGNLLVVIAHIYGVTPVVPTDLTITGGGWTLVAYDNTNPSSSGACFMWAKTAAGGESAITVTITGALRIIVWAAEYSGMDPMTLDGVGGNLSLSSYSYVVSQPIPAYQDGLWVGGLFAFVSAGTGPGTTSAVEVHGAAQRGSNLSHWPAASASTIGRVYDKVSGSSDAPCDLGAKWSLSTTGDTGVCAVFKIAGAVAARPLASGTNSAVRVRNSAGSGASGTSINVAPGGGVGAPDGSLLVVTISIDALRSITASPTGWVLYGGTSFVFSTGSTPLRHYIYYKFALGETGSSYSWTFDASTMWGYISNEWGGGTYSVGNAPVVYNAINVEVFNSGPGKAWSGQTVVEPSVAFVLGHYDGTSGYAAAVTWQGDGGTNPGGGSDFGNKVYLYDIHPMSGGRAQDYWDMLGSAGRSARDLQFIHFSFNIAVGNDVWAWHAGGQEGWR